MIVVEITDFELKVLIDSIQCNQHYGRLKEDEKQIAEEILKQLKGISDGQ